jgi:hypothetical protein
MGKDVDSQPGGEKNSRDFPSGLPRISDSVARSLARVALQIFLAAATEARLPFAEQNLP